MSGPQLVDERLSLGIELTDLGFDLGGHATDGDEQRQLAVTQRVEHLAVVAARPHRFTVGDDRQRGDVLPRLDEIPQRPPDAGHPQACFEERRDQPQRNEVTKRVAIGTLCAGNDEAESLPGSELGRRVASQTGGLCVRETHRGRRFRAGRRVASAPATAGPRSRTGS